MDTFIALSIRQTKEAIKNAKWIDDKDLMCDMLMDEFVSSKGLFIEYHASIIDEHPYCIKASFHDAAFETGEGDLLLDKTFKSRHKEEAQVKARQWLLDNVEKAYQVLLTLLENERKQS